MTDTVYAAKPFKGAMLMLLSCGVITITDAVAKIVLTRVPLGQVIFIRGTFLFSILLVVIGVGGKSGVFRGKSFGSHLLCGVFQVAAAWCFFSGLPQLPFSIAITAAYTNPLFLVRISPWLLSEKVSLARAAAVAIGFLGIALR